MAIRLDHGEDELTEVHDINVTPFIDVILVLLIIFMVAAPLATVDIAVDLPRSGALPQPHPLKPIDVTLKADRTLIVDSAETTLTGLPARLDQISGGDKDRHVRLSVDRAAPYGDFYQLIETVRQAGYLKFNLLGLERREAQ
jgi:TonB system transport protein ExbD (group 1)